MKVPFLLVAGLALSILASACSSEQARTIERQGQRCEDLDILPGEDGRVRAGGASFVPLDGFTPIRCVDDNAWLYVEYGTAHQDRNHTLVTHFGVMELEPAAAALVTPANRMDMLAALAAECVEISRSDPRCLSIESTPSDFSVPEIDCVGWDETWMDIGVPGAEGEEWPMQVRSAICFDSAQPPVYVVVMSWSERHPPGDKGLPSSEAESQSKEFLSSLRFEAD